MWDPVLFDGVVEHVVETLGRDPPHVIGTAETVVLCALSFPIDVRTPESGELGIEPVPKRDKKLGRWVGRPIGWPSCRPRREESVKSRLDLRLH